MNIRLALVAKMIGIFLLVGAVSYLLIVAYIAHGLSKALVNF